MTANSLFLLSADKLVAQEFETLNGLTVPPKDREEYTRHYESALRRENYGTKNRYSDILPAESTRVKLRNYCDTDYINANYVTFDSHSLICAQAPLERTFNDFWQVIWEQNVPIIVSLMRESEHSQSPFSKKAALSAYYPSREGHTLTFGPLRVRLQSVESNIQRDIILRKFSVTCDGEREGRTLTHLQYRGWPDKDVPQSTKPLRDLIALHEELHKAAAAKGPIGPTIVHCSAGVGRTGTFVTSLILLSSQLFQSTIEDEFFLRDFLDESFQYLSHDTLSLNPVPGYVFQLPRARDGWELKLQRRFDIKSIVLSLRQQRNHCMVQTLRQYYFLYEILRDAIIEGAVITQRKKAPIPLSISHPSLPTMRISPDRLRTPNFLRSHSGGETSHPFKLSGQKRKLDINSDLLLVNRTLCDPRSDNTDSLDSIDEEVEALSSEVASLVTGADLSGSHARSRQRLINGEKKNYL